MPDVEQLLHDVDATKCVGIQITNGTEDVTFENPRTYCYSGYVKKVPELKICPGSTESCVFVKTDHTACGSVGVLSYESGVVTLAIMFSNPYDCNVYNREFAIEVFTGRKHFPDMETLYYYMYNKGPPYPCESYQRMEFKVDQDDELNVSNQEIQVKATISSRNRAIIKVQISKKSLTTTLPTQPI